MQTEQQRRQRAQQQQRARERAKITKARVKANEERQATLADNARLRADPDYREQQAKLAHLDQIIALNKLCG